MAMLSSLSLHRKARPAMIATREEVPMLEIGAEAPAFSVQDHHGETVRLADLRGQKVLLWFYPKADTPG